MCEVSCADCSKSRDPICSAISVKTGLWGQDGETRSQEEATPLLR